MAAPFPPAAEKFMPKSQAVDFSTPLDTFNIKDKSILITGSASGIGLACATDLAARGALVTVADLQKDAGTAFVDELTSKGNKAQFVECDVTDYASQVSAFKKAIEFGGGKLDIVIPSAGIVAQANLLDMAAKTEPSLDGPPPPEPGYSGADVNLRGVYWSAYLALHYFRLPPPSKSPNSSFKKSLVFIASSAGYMGYPNSTTYSLSKFGVRGIFYGIRQQALAQNIRVNLLAPWFIKSGMTTNVEAHISSGFGFAPMEYAVDAVVRLAADENVATRSVLVMPEGNVDVGDDVWEGFGGVEVQKALGVRVGAILKAAAESQKGKEDLTVPPRGDKEA